MRYTKRQQEKIPKLAAEWGKAINEWLGIATKLAGGFGLILIVSYCYFEIGFIPSGLTLADTFLYVAISLGFGFILLIFAAYSTYTFYWALEPILEKKWKTIAFNTAIIVFIALSFYFYYSLQNNSLLIIAFMAITLVTSWFLIIRKAPTPWQQQVKSWNSLYLGSILVFLLALGFTILALNKFDSSKVVDVWTSALSAAVPWSLAAGLSNQESSLSKRKNSNWRIPATILLTVGGLILPLVHKDFAQRTLNMTFEKFGIRLENVSIALSTDNAEKIRSISSSQSSGIKKCQLEKGTLTVVYGVNVLWHGFGDKSLIEIRNDPLHPFEPINQKTSSVIDLDRKGITILRNVAQEVCFEIPSTIFKTGEDRLQSKANNDLITTWKEIAKNSKSIKRIEVTGYSDIRPIKGGNQPLSERRAEYIANILTDYGLKKDLVKYYGKGIEEPKSTCNDHLNGTRLDECLAPNRRVEVRVFSSPSSKDKDH